MPAPSGDQLASLAKQHFRSLAIKLPLQWEEPRRARASQQYSMAYSESERSVEPQANLFTSASGNTDHCETAEQLSKHFGEFIDNICAAIADAWSSWQSASTISGVTVNAVVASGGTLSGPPLSRLILSKAPRETEWLGKYSAAIANAMGDAWQQYQSSVAIPGLPLYPALAAFPGPMAPPTPNLPVSLSALGGISTPLEKAALKAQMAQNLAAPRSLHHEALFESIAHAIAQSFTTWQASTQVTNLLATGPIPTFAPPFVPAGPVVMGTATMSAGGLA